MRQMLHVVRAGTGPRMLLIHGSAADHTTWSIQLASRLREQFTLVAYDRASRPTVEAFAEDAFALLADEPSFVVGSSFGAVIALELIRTHRVRGAVLIEPPMGPNEDVSPEFQSFLGDYDRRTAEQGGEAAAEMFLRTVLGDGVYEAMPRSFQERSKSKHAEIRADSAALVAYKPRYAELRDVTTPVLLLAGEKSSPHFRPTIDALGASLGDARIEVIPGAGHMLHAEARRRFAEVVTAFALACP
jgi:pimeloyl-ACP methyl ester carboxylesterase